MTPAEESRLTREANMRIAPASPIAAKTLIELCNLNDAYLEKVIAQMPQSGTYEKEYSGDWGQYRCCEVIEKAFTRPQISSIERQFVAVMGENAATALLNDELLWIALAAGDSPNGAGSSLTTGRLNSATASASWAYQDAKKKWDERYARLGGAFATEFPLNPVPLGFNSDTAWIDKLNREGYELVTDKIKLNYLPEIKRLISQQAQEGIPWNQIASNLRKAMGTGKRWDWVRLVRTEYGNAIDKATMKQYAEMGVPYVQWSASRASGLCDVCEALNGQIFPVDDAPVKPHPQCRCIKVPVWGKSKISVPRTAPVPLPVPALPSA